jgi:hypothetical protein
MGITHDSLAVQAFKQTHGRAPRRSTNERSPDEAWIQNWKAEYVARRVREDPAYAQYYARHETWREARMRRRRLKRAQRAT